MHPDSAHAFIREKNQEAGGAPFSSIFAFLVDGVDTMRGYHFCTSSRSSERGGGPSLRGWFTQGWSRVSDAEGLAASLRPRPSPFCKLQLLSSAAAARNGSRKELVCKNLGRGAGSLRLPARGICRDAGSRTSAHERAQKRDAFSGGTGAKAKSFTGDAQKEAQGRRAAIAAAVF